TVGYRVCGERAIRVDILERLPPPICPALSWRAGAGGPTPAGACDGRVLVVTAAMTSLTGASGEDFASILRSLGYRMQQRPKPAEPAPVVEVGEPAASVAAETTAESSEPVATESISSPLMDASPAPTESVEVVTESTD